MTFSTTTDLMPHQAQAVAKLLPTKVGALFMEMGTGKSRTMLELAKIRQGKWDRLFWFTPVSLKENSLQQLLTHTDIDVSDVAVWDDKVSIRGRLPADKRIHIIGIESMSSSVRVALAYEHMVTSMSFVVVDESAYIKGHKSARTTRITRMSACARYRLVMTGTPFTQGVVDLFAQMSFLSQKILGYRSFHTFARNHIEYRERVSSLTGRKVQTSQIVRAHDTDVLAAKMAPYIYQVRKDECLTLPGKLYETRWCTMTPEQRALYERVKKHILLDLGYEDWSATRIFHLFTALQTVLCGWYSEAGQDTEEVPHNRLSVLLDTVGHIPEHEPVIVWAKYRKSVRQISDALSDRYGSDMVHPYFGDHSESERSKILSEWRSGGRFLVATQAVGGHGLTLTEAAYSIFYADGFKLSERLQAEDRCHRIGQDRKTVYISIRCTGSIDDRIADAIERKSDVLAAFMAEVDTARHRGMKKMALDLVQSL